MSTFAASFDKFTINPTTMPATEHKFINYKCIRYPKAEMLNRSREYYQFMDRRRTIRDFSDKPIPYEIIENIVKVMYFITYNREVFIPFDLILSSFILFEKHN